MKRMKLKLSKSDKTFMKGMLLYLIAALVVLYTLTSCEDANQSDPLAGTYWVNAAKPSNVGQLHTLEFDHTEHVAIYHLYTDDEPSDPIPYGYEDGKLVIYTEGYPHYFSIEKLTRDELILDEWGERLYFKPL